MIGGGARAKMIFGVDSSLGLARRSKREADAIFAAILCGFRPRG